MHLNIRSIWWVSRLTFSSRRINLSLLILSRFFVSVVSSTIVESIRCSFAEPRCWLRFFLPFRIVIFPGEDDMEDELESPSSSSSLSGEQASLSTSSIFLSFYEATLETEARAKLDFFGDITSCSSPDAIFSGCLAFFSSSCGMNAPVGLASVPYIP